MPSRAGLFCWTILPRLQQDELFDDGVAMVSGPTCGSRSDTGENRQVPSETDSSKGSIEWIQQLDANANRFVDASQANSARLFRRRETP
jgi:hypothetical protein